MIGLWVMSANAKGDIDALQHRSCFEIASGERCWLSVSIWRCIRHPLSHSRLASRGATTLRSRPCRHKGPLRPQKQMGRADGTQGIEWREDSVMIQDQLEPPERVHSTKFLVYSWVLSWMRRLLWGIKPTRFPPWKVLECLDSKIPG